MAGGASWRRGKVGEVAAERLPALGLGLAASRPAAPQRRLRSGDQERDGVRHRATAQRDEDDVAPAGRGRAPAVDAHPQEHHRRESEQGDAYADHDEPLAHVPAALLDRRRHLLLEGLEALAVRLAVAFDLLAELREPLSVGVDDGIDDPRHGSLERRRLHRLVAGRDEQVGDVLVAKPAPDGALGRDRRRLVAATADEVEERRRELVRARHGLLLHERRDERRLRVRRRRLLVLAVVARPHLAAVEEPDEGHQTPVPAPARA